MRSDLMGVLIKRSLLPLFLLLAAAFNADAQSITEYTITTSSSGVEHLAAGPNNTIWFTETNKNKVGFIDSSAHITEYTIPTLLSTPRGIVLGPDNAMWFTEAIGKIGRVTADGTFTEYPLSNGRSPHQITLGPDDKLWFTDPAGNDIGRISTAGVITEFSINTANSQPIGITAASDGNLWATFTTGKVAKITPSGTITSYSLPSANSSPFFITQILDGRLAAPEFNAGNIAVITTSGAAAESAITPSGEKPTGIVNGGGGLPTFFLKTVANSIGRLSPSGVFLPDTAIPTAGSIPAQFISDDSGAFWFAETGGNKIAKFTPESALTIQETSLPVGQVGAAYSKQLTGQNGTVPYTFSLHTGALPNGLTLSSSGLISGTPTKFGVSLFTVKITDANGLFNVILYSFFADALLGSDLYAERLSLTRNGSVLTGTYSVRNSGKITAPESTVKVFLSNDAKVNRGDQLVQRRRVRALAFGDGVNFRFRTVSRRLRGKHLIVCVDCDHEVMEISENNDIYDNIIK
jgi:virginiamycin B lyase